MAHFIWYRLIARTNSQAQIGVNFDFTTICEGQNWPRVKRQTSQIARNNTPVLYVFFNRSYHHPYQSIIKLYFIIPSAQRSWKVYTGLTISVCPSVDGIVSTLYLLKYSQNPFYIYTPFWAISEGLSPAFVFQNSQIWCFGKFFNFVTLTLSGFDFGSNMNWSIVWVIARWVSSERRHSGLISHRLRGFAQPTFQLVLPNSQNRPWAI